MGWFTNLVDVHDSPESLSVVTSSVAQNMAEELSSHAAHLFERRKPLTSADYDDEKLLE